MHLSKRATFTLFCLYIILLVLLPGGSIFGVNVKILVFLPVAILAVKQVMEGKDGLYQLGVSACLMALFIGWIFVAQWYFFYDVVLSLSQYRDIISTFAGCWFVRIFIQSPQDRARFLCICLYAVAFGGFIKLVIFAYSLSSGVPISVIMDGISRAFGVQLMTFELGDLGVRIQFPSDTLVPVSLFAVLCIRKPLKISGIVSFAIVALLLSSSILTFSRFIWFYTAVGALLGFVTRRQDRMHFLYLGALAAAIASSYDLLWTLIQLRFSSQVVDSSDADRTAQKSALEMFFKEAPLLGHGLGSYTNQVIRARDLPYNYEMQIFALAGQVGTVGIVILLGILINYYRKAFTFEVGSRAYQGAVMLMLGCFMTSGFFNPYLVSSIAAATFGMLFALASFKEFTDVVPTQCQSNLTLESNGIGSLTLSRLKECPGGGTQ